MDPVGALDGLSSASPRHLQKLLPATLSLKLMLTDRAPSSALELLPQNVAPSPGWLCSGASRPSLTWDWGTAQGLGPPLSSFFGSP